MTITLDLRRSIAAFLSLLLVCVLGASSAWALTPEQARPIADNLHQVRVHSYQAIRAFYNFSLAPGDKLALTEVREEINAVNSAMNTLESTEGVTEIQDALTALSAKWHEYKELLNTNVNDVVEQGYPDLRLVSDMAQRNVDMNELAAKAYREVQEKSGYNPPANVELIRQSIYLLESMATKYAARSASSASQIFQGADTEKPMDEQARLLDKNLEKLTNMKLPADLEKTLDRIQAQWAFIRGSFINYNENNVYYVVNRYSRRIVELFNEMLASLESA
ncbi:hypothetical protein AAIA72_01495 [Hahella sp. SMD15-11]|uniref:Uncharacterized protein n=1 Tax=Thermohahella caldifontis TaxID=3142973 RepID=A0AB39UWW2_9GAMM